MAALKRPIAKSIKSVWAQQDEQAEMIWSQRYMSEKIYFPQMLPDKSGS